MKLKVLNNWTGNYNLLNPNEKTFSFTMVIQDDENKIVEVNGIKAKIHFSGSVDEQTGFKNPISNLEYVFEKCFEFAHSVWSTEPYKEQTLTFLKVYRENYDFINKHHLEETKKEIKEEIALLQKKLEKRIATPDITDQADYLLSRRISEIREKIKREKVRMEDYKKDSETYRKAQERIENYIDKIRELQEYESDDESDDTNN